MAESSNSFFFESFIENEYSGFTHKIYPVEDAVDLDYWDTSTTYTELKPPNVNHLMTPLRSKPKRSKKTKAKLTEHNLFNIKTYMRVDDDEETHANYQKQVEDLNFSGDLSSKKLIPCSQIEEEDPPIRSHICLVCQKTFLKRHHLKEHMVVHSNDKPYECDKCDFVTKWKSHLKRHFTIKHSSNNKETEDGKADGSPTKKMIKSKCKQKPNNTLGRNKPSIHKEKVCIKKKSIVYESLQQLLQYLTLYSKKSENRIYEKIPAVLLEKRFVIPKNIRACDYCKPIEEGVSNVDHVIKEENTNIINDCDFDTMDNNVTICDIKYENDYKSDHNDMVSNQTLITDGNDVLLKINNDTKKINFQQNSNDNSCNMKADACNGDNDISNGLRDDPIVKISDEQELNYNNSLWFQNVDMLIKKEDDSTYETKPQLDKQVFNNCCNNIVQKNFNSENKDMEINNKINNNQTQMSTKHQSQSKENFDNGR